MHIYYEEAQPEQYKNRAALARMLPEHEGCIYVGPLNVLDAPELNAEQKELYRQCQSRCFPDERLGVVEIYENGAMNIRLLKGDTPVGYFLIR